MAPHDHPDAPTDPATGATGLDQLRPGEPSDADLIARVRSGELEAYGDLFHRHNRAAHRLAAQFSGVNDVDDLVAEAFAKVLDALTGGSGPEQAFRPYLLVAMRRIHVARLRAAQRMRPTDDDAIFDRQSPANTSSAEDPVLESFDGRAAARAFASLPERWQAVLWHTEVEGERPADIAPLLGLSPNAVSALAYRARERLRREFLQQHVADNANDRCRRTIERLSGYTRSGLTVRENREVRRHLDSCARCTATYLELTEVNRTLPAVLAPAVLGVAGLGYLASVGTGCTAAVLTGAGSSGPSAPTPDPAGAVQQVGSEPAPATTTAGNGSLALAGATMATVIAGAIALIFWTGGDPGSGPHAAQPPRLTIPATTPRPSPTPGSVRTEPTRTPTSHPTATPTPSATIRPSASPTTSTASATPDTTPTARPTETPTAPATVIPTEPTVTPSSRPTVAEPSSSPGHNDDQPEVIADEGLAQVRSNAVTEEPAGSGRGAPAADHAVKLFKLDIRPRGIARTVKVVIEPGPALAWQRPRQTGWICTPTGTRVSCVALQPAALTPLRLGFLVASGQDRDGRAFSFRINATAAMTEPAETTFTDTDRYVHRASTR